MEKEIIIKSPDGFNIYGTLNNPKEKSDGLIIFVHGFTGFRHEHIFYNGAKYFKEKGYSTFRFDLYSGEKNGRTFTDCDIQTHVDDLRTVLNHFKNKFKKVFLVGHSMGGMVVLESELDVSGIILWDCSHSFSKVLNKECKFNKSLDAYLLNWGVVYLVGKKMYEDKQHYAAPKELMENVKCPIKIICAEKGVLVKGGKEYYELAKKPKDFAIIKEAGHTFDEEGTEEILFEETLIWVEKY